MATGSWKYYNYMMIPECEPHERVDVTCLEKKDFWKKQKGQPLLARWHEDFDCNEKTEWWYVICDKPFNIMNPKSKSFQEVTERI